MQELQTEIQDITAADPEHQNDTVVTAGTPIIVNRSDSKNITLAYVKNPSKGTRANGISDVVYVSIDGTAPTANGTTLARGEYVYLPGYIQDGDLKFDSNNDGTEVEVILWG